MLSLEEIWKPIYGFESLYEVSNLGRVRSLGRFRIRTGSCKVPKSTTVWNYKPKILKPIHMHQYVKVHLYEQDGKRYAFILSHLVANAFILPEHAKVTKIYYKDNNPSNCSVSNLDVRYQIGDD